MRVLARRPLLQSPRRVLAVLALRQNQQHGTPLARGEQAFQELHGSRVRPVQILQRYHDGPLGREPLEEHLNDLERPVLERFGGQLAEPDGRLRLEREPEQRREVRRQLLCSLSAQPFQLPAHGDPRPQLGSSTPTPSQPRRSSRNGQYGSDSPYETHLPSSHSPSKASWSSCSRRLLPIPASPVTKRMPPAPARRPASASSPAASSRSRPCIPVVAPSSPRSFAEPGLTTATS